MDETKKPILVLESPNPLFALIFFDLKMHVFYIMAIIIMFSGIPKEKVFLLLFTFFIFIFGLTLLMSFHFIYATLRFRKIEIYNSNAIVINDKHCYINFEVETKKIVVYSAGVHLQYFSIYYKHKNIGIFYLEKSAFNVTGVTMDEIENIFHSNMIKVY